MVSGVTPFLTTLLYMHFGWMGPALLFLAYSVIGFGSTLVTRETWGPQERQEAERLAAATPHDQFGTDVSVGRPFPAEAVN
jgi:hypothetical protein